MARPTKLNPDTQANILEALRTGCTMKDAALYAGIAPDTVYRWLKRGDDEEAEEPYRTFRRSVDRTCSQVKLRLLGYLQQAAAGDWRAAAWYLERRHAEEFGRRDKVDVQAETKVQAELRHRLDAEIEEILSNPDHRAQLDDLAEQLAHAERAPGSSPLAMRAVGRNGNGRAGHSGAPVEGDAGGNSG